MQLKLVEVKTKKDKKKFHQFTKDLYASDPAYISHIYQDIESVFSPAKYAQMGHSGACRWLAYYGERIVGKIAAFYNKTSHQYGLGFFDCIDDQIVANTLFNKGIAWLQAHCSGIDRVEAPVNFGERDKYWGLLVEGFQSPSYQENYNAPYYKLLFENYGFTKAIEQTTSEAKPTSIDYQKYARFTDRLARKGGFRAEHFKTAEMPRFVRDFTLIYNQAWQHHEHFVPFTEERVALLFKDMKPIIREDILWFLYADDRPIAFYLSIIDLNQIFKYVDGSMNFLGKLRFLWYRRFVKMTKVRGIIFGVIPEFQDKGVYSILILKMYKVMMQDPHLQSTELAWIGDFNPKMHALFKTLGAVKTKVHYTYQKLL